MFRPSTITVAAIAACGVTLALGASVAVPRFVHPIAGVPPVAEEASPRKIGPRQIPHKFMQAPPSSL